MASTNTLQQHLLQLLLVLPLLLLLVHAQKQECIEKDDGSVCCSDHGSCNADYQPLLPQLGAGTIKQQQQHVQSSAIIAIPACHMDCRALQAQDGSALFDCSQSRDSFVSYRWRIRKGKCIHSDTFNRMPSSQQLNLLFELKDKCEKQRCKVRREVLAQSLLQRMLLHGK